MSPLAARFDRFVRWFVNSSPSALIASPVVAASLAVDTTGGRDLATAPARGAIAPVWP